jgi:hypothetical protein
VEPAAVGYDARCIFLEILIRQFIFQKSKQNKYIKNSTKQQPFWAELGPAMYFYFFLLVEEDGFKLTFI